MHQWGTQRWGAGFNTNEQHKLPCVRVCVSNTVFDLSKTVGVA